MTALEHQHDILGNLKTAVLLIKPDLSVAYINVAAEALLDISGRRVIGESLDNLFREEEVNDNRLFDALKLSHTFTKHETKLRLSNRQLITVDCAVTPITENDVITAMIMELQPLDLVLRISREEALLTTQENTHALVLGMAHEIKNPLGGLRGAAQLLAKQLPDKNLLDYTNIIIEEADRLTNLIDRMLGSNTLPDLKSLNIHEILEHVKQLIDAETAENIKLVRDYDPSTPELIGDKEQLIQAVLNITRNAMQALHSSHTPSACITFKTRVLRQFTIGSKRHRLVCHVDISDNGPGIPDNLKNTLFLPMVSGKSNGTGLGLSLSQNIINQHKGLIECRNQTGSTTFSIYIPIESDSKLENRA